MVKAANVSTIKVKKNCIKFQWGKLVKNRIKFQWGKLVKKTCYKEKNLNQISMGEFG
jgi:hypothetical protein